VREGGLGCLVEPKEYSWTGPQLEETRSASDGVLDLWVFLLSELASSVASPSLLTMLWESVFVSFEHSFTWSCMPPGWVGALWWW
jgi:hypothetical protein